MWCLSVTQSCHTQSPYQKHSTATTQSLAGIVPTFTDGEGAGFLVMLDTINTGALSSLCCSTQAC